MVNDEVTPIQEPEQTVPKTTPPVGVGGILAALIGSAGTNGFSAILLVWMVTVELPNQRVEYMNELRAEREVRSRQVEQTNKALMDLTGEIRELKRFRN